MSPSTRFTADAEDDLAEAAQWYEVRAGFGEEFVTRVREAVIRIEKSPEAFPVIHRGVRRAVVKRFPYGVFYRIRKDEIEVVAIYHNRRDPRKWQRRS